MDDEISYVFHYLSEVETDAEKWPETGFSYNRVLKILEKLHKLRRSRNHKWNINRIYYEKLRYNGLQQLPTLRLKILENCGIRKKGNEKLYSYKLSFIVILFKIAKKQR